MKNVKCKICDKKIPIDKAILKKGTKSVYYCSENCRDKDNKKKKQSEKTDWQSLMDFLSILYIKPNYGFLCSQINKMKKEYGYKDSGIQYTLNYMYNIIDMNFNDGYGLGLVPYYYDEARAYWNEVQNLKKETDSFTFNDVVKTVKKKNIPEILLNLNDIDT